MDSINSLAGYSPVPAQKSPAAGSTNQADAGSRRPAMDTYTPDDMRIPAPKSKTTPFTGSMAMDLAGIYDVRNMNRGQYTKLLVALRDMGVLTSQEFSAAYGGSMPSAAGSFSWPKGYQKVDFTKLLRDCSRLCMEIVSGSAGGASEKINNETLSSTYSHLNEIFSEIADAAAPTEDSSLAEAQLEVERLTALLKEDKEFCENSYRDFKSHPVAQKLAFAMILADKQVQSQVAAKLGVSVPQMKEMMNSKDKVAVDQVKIQYHCVLVDKAKSEGLTDTEILLSDHLERVNFLAQASFDERMEGIKKEINQAMEEKGMQLDPDKSYSFRLDTSDFTFSVTGGTEEENTIIAGVINGNDNVSTAMSAMYGHKKAEGQEVSAEYLDKMERLFPAYNQRNQEIYMQNRYGFGMDDIEYKGGYTIIGKTDAITEQIRSLGMDFIKFGGGELLVNVDSVLLSKYGFGLHEVDFTEDGKLVGRTKEVQALIRKGGDEMYEDIKHPPKVEVPVFEQPVFTLENGQFNALYG